MNTFRPDAALDPTVPLETVEQWIEPPSRRTRRRSADISAATPIEQVTEYISEPEYAPVTEFVPVQDYLPDREYSATQPYAPTPQYVSNAEYMPVSEYAVTESVTTEQPITDAFVAKVIKPVRSPGIVLPEASPKPEAVDEEAEAEEAEDLDEETPKHILPWVFLVLAVLICLIALAQLVPGWWSQFIAGLVDGYSGRGAGWGAGIGFLFTYIATLMIGHAVHKWASWKAPVALVVGGLIVAAPNLFTLWINRGPTTAARNADALLDRTAPLFRGASLAGAAAGLVLGILTTVLYRLWRKRTRRIKAMESLVDDYA